MASPTYYNCNVCGFYTQGNFSQIGYILNKNGERVFVPHAWNGKVDGRMHQTVCLDCLHQFKLDFDADELKFTSCFSTNIVRTHETEKKVCPKCKEGIILKKVDRYITI